MKKFVTIALLPVVAALIAASLIAQDGRRTNAPIQTDKPYVLLISIDGFRPDYLDLHGAPNLERFATAGVRAESMIPSYPSETFPNMYTLVTGMYPGNHGIVGNEFFDRNRRASYDRRDPGAVRDGSWYGGTPLWVAAEKEGMLSGSYYWMGSEAAIAGVRPAYYIHYEPPPLSDQERVEGVLEWMSLPEESRPHLITLYFSAIDSVAHQSGTNSEELGAAIAALDREIGFLLDAIEELPFEVNVFILSDHGMVDRDPEKVIYLDDYIDLKGIETVGLGPHTFLYLDDNPELIDTLYDELRRYPDVFRVYKREETPPQWHSNHERLGDLVIDAVPPWSVSFRFTDARFDGGAHGYDPYLNEEMHAIFYARGPNLAESTVIPSFDNIHVYPLIMEILGLEIPEGIDGRLEVLEGILRR